MRKHLLTLFSIVLLCGLTSAAWAATLQEAKAEGLIGEQRDGYVGFVVDNVPSDIRALVRGVNAERRKLYQEIAAENGLQLNQVAALAYEEAVEATRSGHYIQDAGGSWVKK